MLIRWTPWDHLAGDVTNSSGDEKVQLLRRLGARRRRRRVLGGAVDGGRRGGVRGAPAGRVRPRHPGPGPRGRASRDRRLVRGVRPHRLAPAPRQPQRRADDGDRLRVLPPGPVGRSTRRSRCTARDVVRGSLERPVRRAAGVAPHRRPARVRRSTGCSCSRSCCRCSSSTSCGCCSPRRWSQPAARLPRRARSPTRSTRPSGRSCSPPASPPCWCSAVRWRAATRPRRRALLPTSRAPSSC